MRPESMLENALNAWVIRGYSVLAVLIVLGMITSMASVICGVAWWVNPRLLVLAVPTSAILAFRIWRAYE